MNIDSWKLEATLFAEAGHGPRWISRALDIPYTTVQNYLSKTSDGKTVKSCVARFQNPTPHLPMLRWTEEVNQKVIDKPCFTVDNEVTNGNILLISDMHIPYHHRDTLDFLSDLNREYKPSRIICMGDELDKHSLSFHDSDPELSSAGDELKAALPTITALHKLFPKMDLLESNHGSLIYRKAKHHGIPRQYLKTYNEVLGVTEGWKWHFDLTVGLPTGNSCYFHHGKVSDVQKLSQAMGMCAAQGHFHNDFSVKYWSNPHSLYWALQTGCLIDTKSLAFKYNNVNVKRPIIGTAVLVEGFPVLVPMKL